MRCTQTEANRNLQMRANKKAVHQQVQRRLIKFGGVISSIYAVALCARCRPSHKLNARVPPFDPMGESGVDPLYYKYVLPVLRKTLKQRVRAI